MEKVYTSADQLIGKTPLLELVNVEQKYELEAKIMAKLEYLNPAGFVKDRIAKAEELAKEIPNSFTLSQFENLSNPKIHLTTTGPEIYEDTEGKIDYFVAGIGTGGTITGVGEYLKSKNPDYEEILNHCIAGLPNEACGLIAGTIQEDS